MNVWLITGASRGLGREIARQALDRGDAVVAAARQPEHIATALPGYGDRLLAVPLDVTDPAQPAAVAQAAAGRFGRIDILVNNAGRGLLGAEVAPLGIGVVIIEPGSFRTDFLDGSSLHAASQVIMDYAATAGQVRNQAAARNHAQVNDPVRGAAAIMTIATVADPPARLQLGADSVAAVEAKLQQVTDELNKWRELAVSTTHHDAA
jgi:NAD(P)-dependent dehydrogenase (short-subunit alcohol dehydrogenase family)